MEDVRANKLKAGMKIKYKGSFKNIKSVGSGPTDKRKNKTIDIMLFGVKGNVRVPAEKRIDVKSDE